MHHGGQEIVRPALLHHAAAFAPLDDLNMGERAGNAIADVRGSSPAALPGRAVRLTEDLGEQAGVAGIAISEQQKKELVEDFRIAPANKFHLVPLGFNLDKFREDQEAKRLSFRQEFQVGAYLEQHAVIAAVRGSGIAVAAVRRKS